MRVTLKTAAALAAALAAAIAIAGCGSSKTNTGTSASTGTQTMATPTTSGPSSTLGYEGIPLELGGSVAPASSTAPGTPVDGIQCAAEQLAYHIHAHLAVYAEGEALSLPAGIGIPGAKVQQTQYGQVVGQGTCFYWLHTHTTDGVIHIESPTQRIYTLGNFFDEWRQPLTATQVASVRGKVTAYVNGKLFAGSPRNIPLNAHAVIQLDVGGKPPPFMPISFAGSNL
jgi:hypothetical protein